MPPEETQLLIAIDFRLDGHDKLVGHEERMEQLADDKIFASWYAEEQPEGYVAMCGGVVYVRDSNVHPGPPSTKRPTEAGGRYTWRDVNRSGGVMFVMVLPEGYTLRDPDPLPYEAKNFQGRLAVHWRTPPPEGETFEVSWGLSAIAGGVDIEKDRINKIISDSRRAGATPQFDVALSYASEDREYVEQVVAALKQHGVTYFYDRDENQAVDLWGKNIYQHLTEVYSKRARYAVLFISTHYAKKRWTSLEVQSAQARAFLENREYILPARFDDTEIPGLLPVVAYLSLKEISPVRLAEMIAQKVGTNRI